MNKKWIKAADLWPALSAALTDFSDEDWFRLNIKANELISEPSHVLSNEPVVVNEHGLLLQGFTTVFRAIQLDTNVLVHSASA